MSTENEEDLEEVKDKTTADTLNDECDDKETDEGGALNEENPIANETLAVELEKVKNDYIRLYAEMENMKKRTLAETEKTIKFAVSSFAKELLGVADNLERAIAAMANNKDACAELLKGVELTQSELTKVFAKFGIERFNHIGEKFDPNFERVVQEIENKDAESGTILAELQAGYTIHDRILREAMVIVAR